MFQSRRSVAVGLLAGSLVFLNTLGAAEPVPPATVFQRVYLIPVVAPMPTASNAGRTLVPVQNLVPRSIDDTQTRPVQPSIVPQNMPIPVAPGYDMPASPTIQYMPYGQTVLSDSINHPQVSSGGFGGGCSSCGESTYTGRYQLLHKCSTKFYRLLVCGPQYPCGSDGCGSPLGCNNIHSATAFLFGSCRTFFGNQTSAPSHCNKGPFPK